MHKRIAQLVVAMTALFGVAVAQIAPAGAANLKSDFDAGVFAQTKLFASATARLRMPEMDCSVGTVNPLEIHLGWSGTSTGGLISVNFDIVIDCTEGFSASARLSETDPSGTESRVLPVAGNDVITVNLRFDAGIHRMTATARNVTQKAVASVAATTQFVALNTATYFLENKDGTPIPSFKAIPFSNLTLNGSPAATTFIQSSAYNLVNPATQKTLVRTNPFNPAGDFFKLAFVAAE